MLKLRDDYLARPSEETAFRAILDIADNLVATYMTMANQFKWFYDRNAFLKNQELLNQERIVQASGQLVLKEAELKAMAMAVLKRIASARSYDCRRPTGKFLAYYSGGSVCSRARSRSISDEAMAKRSMVRPVELF